MFVIDARDFNRKSSIFVAPQLYIMYVYFYAIRIYPFLFFTIVVVVVSFFLL